MHSRQSGFTLIELSIVLVIIGLIVGSVLVGQDLIKAAQLRATMRQSEEFTTAANTFRVKYNALPSDIPTDQAAQLGFFQYTGPISPGTPGNNSGFIGVLPDFAFWRHLTDAQLINGNYGTIGNSALDPTTGEPTGRVTNLSQSFPPAKVGNNIYFWAGGGSLNNIHECNFFLLIGETWYVYDPGHPGWDTQPSFFPIDAMTIDTKMDDGLPFSGRTQVLDLNDCTKAVGSDYIYNISATDGACEPVILWQ